MVKIGRIDKDAYQTPSWVVEALMKYIYFKPDYTFLEPCVGEGNIINNIPLKDKMWCEINEGIDYLKIDIKNHVDIIITNPPFSLAQEFLIKSLREAPFVAYLLRINYFGSQYRKDFWDNNKPTHLFPLSKRPCFVWICKGHKKKNIKSCKRKYSVGYLDLCECGCKVGSGTDSTEYAWFVWDRLGLLDNLNHWLTIL